jgi:glycosyltransferase involved in cell wall biosynthesis
MKILVFPRDNSNPYQHLLYGEMQRLGARVTYVGRLTPSHTLNLLLLPLELVARRVTGGRLVHLHWVFAFFLPGSGRFPVLRRLAQAWFAVWLCTIRMLGVRLVWTAHNTLPHGPVFADDLSARRALVEASDLVIAHSQAALEELKTLGAVPVRSAVIQHGPLAPTTTPAASLRTPGTGDGPRRFVFFGKVRDYKGVEELLAAFSAVPDELAAHLTVAGECDNPQLRKRLDALARRGGRRIVLRLEQVSEEEVTPLLAAADAVVMPYRRITTSGSAMLALAHGRPVIIPDLASLADLPKQAVVRYDGTVPALSAALVRVARADATTLAMMSAAARAYSENITWQDIAARTMSEMISLFDDAPCADTPDKRAHRSVK